MPAFGAGTAAAVGRVGAGLVHELETSTTFGLQRFDTGCPQGPHAAGVAPGRVDTLFFRRPSSACTARPSVAWLTAGPPGAAIHARNSSKVAPGCGRWQAANPARANASGHGADPPRKGKAAREPPANRSCGGGATASPPRKPSRGTEPQRGPRSGRALHRPLRPAPVNPTNTLSRQENTQKTVNCLENRSRCVSSQKWT